MALWEEAPKVFFLGVEVYAFGLYAALGAALALLVVSLLLRREGAKKGTAPLMGALCLALGFLGSRLLFCLLDRSLGGMMPLRGFFLVTGGGYSMMGALAGGCLGAALAGRLTGQSPLRMVDLAAPALLLFAACERLGEGYLSDFGVSRPLLGDALRGSFLAVEGAYDWYLATYLLESFAALVLALILLRSAEKRERPGNTLLLSMLLYGAVQTLMESLRYDRHMSFSFVGAQHVLAMALLGAAVILLAARNWKTRRGLALAAIVSVPLVAGLGVGLEFMIDRTTLSRYLLYAAYVLMIAVPTCLGLRLRKEA